MGGSKLKKGVKTMSTPIDYKVFNVVKRKGKDDFWNRLGGAFAFQTDDGRNGINIPALNIVLLEPKAEENGEAEDFNQVNTGAEA